LTQPIEPIPQIVAASADDGRIDDQRVNIPSADARRRHGGIP